ncbi:hypothetical protein [Pseudoclavibacter helvolus]|uniref:hypothetical protein n=1 Tax=Pseudoclavibacter helvolus TaxID=255205 RepID=UPI003C735C2D
MSVTPPRVAVISAVDSCIAPARDAITSQLPDADVWNLLDDRLLVEARAAGEVGPDLAARMDHLIDHALEGGADAILVTCSVYGDAVRSRAARETIPVLASDDAGFDRVLASGINRVLLISPIQEGLDDSTARLAAAAEAAGQELEIVGAVAHGAHAAASRGTVALRELLVRVVEGLDARYDAVLLGQYSIAPGAPALEQATGLPVFTTPGAAGERLAELVTAAAS